MTHQEVIDHEIVEAYVLGKLPLEERRAFQEHFFECDECFQQAQDASQRIARLRYAGHAGALRFEETTKARPSRSVFNWWRPVFISAVAVVLLALVAVSIWSSRNRVQTRADERQAQTGAGTPSMPSPTQGQQPVPETPEISQTHEQPPAVKPTPRPAANLIAQANNPRVLLESTRSANEPENQIAVPPNAKSILLMI